MAYNTRHACNHDDNARWLASKTVRARVVGHNKKYIYANDYP